jgi:hypothetical protein
MNIQETALIEMPKVLSTFILSVVLSQIMTFLSLTRKVLPQKHLKITVTMDWHKD